LPATTGNQEPAAAKADPAEYKDKAPFWKVSANAIPELHVVPAVNVPETYDV
jgi:hypothetical protein